MTANWIGYGGGVLAALVTLLVALRQARMAVHLARLNHELDAELHRRGGLLERELRAEEVLRRYREPLAAAAFDLQSRVYNITALDFFMKFGHGDRADEAFRTTVFRFAQYFGWSEILRRDVQLLDFPDDATTRRVAHLQWRIARCLLSDAYGPALMIWADEQREIGERMIVQEHGRTLCLGPAAFAARWPDGFAAWGERLRPELLDPSARARLIDLQHLLCELVEVLDARGFRPAETLLRAA